MPTECNSEQLILPCLPEHIAIDNKTYCWKDFQLGVYSQYLSFKCDKALVN